MKVFVATPMANPNSRINTAVNAVLRVLGNDECFILPDEIVLNKKRIDIRFLELTQDERDKKITEDFQVKLEEANGLIMFVTRRPSQGLGYAEGYFVNNKPHGWVLKVIRDNDAEKIRSVIARNTLNSEKIIYRTAKDLEEKVTIFIEGKRYPEGNYTGPERE